MMIAWRLICARSDGVTIFCITQSGTSSQTNMNGDAMDVDGADKDPKACGGHWLRRMLWVHTCGEKMNYECNIDHRENNLITYCYCSTLTLRLMYAYRLIVTNSCTPSIATNRCSSLTFSAREAWLWLRDHGSQSCPHSRHHCNAAVTALKLLLHTF